MKLNPPGAALEEVHELIREFAPKGQSNEVVTAVNRIPAREARWAPMPDWVRSELVSAYREKGITQLYSHQAEAAERVHSGKNVAIVTPTASGKTLCYNLTVLNAVLENP